MMAERGRRHKRLRPWLEGIINSGDIPGLCWIDNDCSMFRIPWPHRNSQNWTTDSGRVFMEWAIQTGRYREGVDKPDYATWKQRLRSAFAKAPDIEEVKELHQQDSVTSPYKVYKLLPVPVERRQAAAAVPGSSDQHLTAAVTPRGFQYVDMSQEFDEHSPPLQNTGLLTEYSNWTQPALRRDGKLVVNVYYCGNEVLRTAVRSASGCLLCYAEEASPNQDLATALNYSQCDDSNLEMLRLPQFSNYGYGSEESMQERQGRMLLEKGLRRALVLRSNDQGDICAYRLCQCAVFYTSDCGSNPVSNTQTIKLPRATDYLPPVSNETNASFFHKVFDYRNKYIPALNRYVTGCGPKPDPRVIFVFGQQVDAGAIRSRIDSQVLVVATVQTVQALEDLRRAEEMTAARTPSIEMSLSNEFDRIVHGAHSLRLDTNPINPIYPNNPNNPIYPNVAPDSIELKFSPTLEMEEANDEQESLGACAMKPTWEEWTAR